VSALAPAPAPPAPPAPPASAPGAAIGRFLFTFYWEAEETDFADPSSTFLYDRSCVPLAAVSLAYLKSLAMEGTGRLVDGRLVNFESRCLCGWANVPCFQEIADDDPRSFGIGVEGRGLSPFRSVAVDQSVIPIGTKLYVPDLDGLIMPGEPPWGGFVHDGCLVADDRGSAIDDLQLDFYSVKRNYYREIDRALNRKKVSVFEAGDRCP
jgi:3D (Asp-Asp-Asp) domain-containing protein